MNAELKDHQEIANQKGLNQHNAGYSDCKNGVPHVSGKHLSYDQGYGRRYEEESRIGWGFN